MTSSVTLLVFFICRKRDVFLDNYQVQLSFRTALLTAFQRIESSTLKFLQKTKNIFLNKTAYVLFNHYNLLGKQTFPFAGKGNMLSKISNKERKNK